MVGAMAHSVVPMEPREWYRLQSLEMGAAVVPASSAGRFVCRNITCLHDAHAPLDIVLEAVMCRYSFGGKMPMPQHVLLCAALLQCGCACVFLLQISRVCVRVGCRRATGAGTVPRAQALEAAGRTMVAPVEDAHLTSATSATSR